MTALQIAEVITHGIEIIDKLIGSRAVDIIVDTSCCLHAMAHVQTIEWKLN